MMLRTKNSPTMSLLEEWELREGNAATLDSLIVMMEELENASALQVLQQVKGLCVHVGFNLFLFSLSPLFFLPLFLLPVLFFLQSLLLEDLPQDLPRLLLGPLVLRFLLQLRGVVLQKEDIVRQLLVAMFLCPVFDYNLNYL